MVLICVVQEVMFSLDLFPLVKSDQSGFEQKKAVKVKLVAGPYMAILDLLNQYSVAIESFFFTI